MSDPLTPPEPEHPHASEVKAFEPGLDAAQQSLSDALGVSFTVLKGLMFLLIFVYLFSGIFQVDEKNKAIRLRFGEIVGQQAGYSPGWYVGMPFPIEQVIQIPTNEQRVNIDKAFWYDNPDNRTPEQLAMKPLDPLVDGFLITGDTNVVHVQFEVGYVIDKPADYVSSVGDLERAKTIVEMAAERGMLVAVASTSTEDIINRRFPIENIVGHIQTVLDELGTGIRIQKVTIGGEASTPLQVRQAYEAVTAAQSQKGTVIENARRDRNKILSDTSGVAHSELFEMIRAYEAALGAGHDELSQALRQEVDQSFMQLQMFGGNLDPAIDGYIQAMTNTRVPQSLDADNLKVDRLETELQARRDQSQAALLVALAQAAENSDSREGKPIRGEAARQINQAMSYQTMVIARVNNELDKFRSYLPEYRLKPRLFTNELWQASRERVFAAGLNEIVYGPTDFVRINTDSDPQRRNEMAEVATQRDREAARQRSNETRGR